MARKVRIKLNKKGVGELLKGEGDDNHLPDYMSDLMDKVEAKVESAPEMEGYTANRESYIGHDRARESLGIPGDLEAEYGTASRGLNAL